MKNIVLLFLGAILLVSCGKSEGEQMLYDYQQNNVKALNFDLKDLDFKIEQVESIGNVLSIDSANYCKQELAEFWDTDASQTLIDTLSFSYVKSKVEGVIAMQDTLADIYQKSVILAIQLDDYSMESRAKRNRDAAIKKGTEFEFSLLKVERIEEEYNKFSAQPDSVLSTKYRAIYSLKNPMLSNVKQTFDKIFYTNAAQTKFIKEETFEEE